MACSLTTHDCFLWAQALALAFERQPHAAPYVGALQRLAIEDRGGSVDAENVAEAARASGSLQAGALQVETRPVCWYSNSWCHAADATGRLQGVCMVTEPYNI